MSSSSKGKGSVKTKFWNKHHNKWQKKAQEKAVREDGKKQIRNESKLDALAEKVKAAGLDNADFRGNVGEFVRGKSLN
tara:strand:- start:741 stop:974 length:234 start_codon:yes stop_codon:yes gene_type:complete